MRSKVVPRRLPSLCYLFLLEEDFMKNLHAPKGTHDLIKDEARAFEHITNIARLVASLYGFDPLVTPVFESADLFTRSVGDATDIVTKEMYVFEDKGKRTLALRPEGTASIVRSVITNKLYATNDLPLRLYYDGTMYRYERPQLGRYREFRQFGVESIGVNDVFHDLEVMLLAIHILQALGFQEVTTRINSLGTEEARTKYKEALKAYYKPHLEHVCSDCKVRYEKNPLRLLDCKVPSDALLAEKAPHISSFLSTEDEADLTFVHEALNGLGILTTIDRTLVRGLDYYSGIIFEFSYVPSSGKDYGAIGGGGRYDKLVSELGGPDLVGVGFAFGLERLYHILAEEQKLAGVTFPDDIIVIAKGERARNDAFSLLTSLRTHEVRGIMHFDDKSFKSLFKIADERGAKYALIIGEEEVNNEVVTVRDLTTQTQEQISYNAILNHVLTLVRGHNHHDHHHDCHCQSDDCECENGDCDCKKEEK